ncbi:TPA: hypothetical protein DD712_04200 [Candidatus Acetothermia bacterium]|nr:hypothetical protein [Candidatus Acetothermia bacterium]
MLPAGLKYQSQNNIQMASTNTDKHNLMVNYRNAMSNPVGAGPRACPAQLLCRACPDHANRIMVNHRIIGNHRGLPLQEAQRRKVKGVKLTMLRFRVIAPAYKQARPKVQEVRGKPPPRRSFKAKQHQQR